MVFLHVSDVVVVVSVAPHSCVVKQSVVHVVVTALTSGAQVDLQPTSHEVPSVFCSSHGSSGSPLLPPCWPPWSAHPRPRQAPPPGGGRQKAQPGPGGPSRPPGVQVSPQCPQKYSHLWPPQPAARVQVGPGGPFVQVTKGMGNGTIVEEELGDVGVVLGSGHTKDVIVWVRRELAGPSVMVTRGGRMLGVTV